MLKSKISSKKPDYIFALTIFLIVFFGIVMVSSSSVVASYEKFGNNYYFVRDQIISLLIGLVALFITSNIDYRFWKKHSFWMMIVTLASLILVFMPVIGKEINGAHRWIGIGGHTFQPSEIVKLAFIIYLASWFDNRKEQVVEFTNGFIPFALMIGVVGVLIMKQPDLGTMSVIAGVAGIMYLVAGASLWHFSIGIGFSTLLLGILIAAAPYRMQRLLVFLNPSADTQGASYHINQALLAVGAGGLWGLGFGQSRQKYLYLPQTQTDSIFAVTAEELGFVRTSMVLLVFMYLGYRGFQIAKKAPDNFARLLVVGIVSWILLQAFINIAAMLNLLPLTGVPLPFISYGGTSLIILLAAVGIVLNISKHIEIRN